MASQRWPKIFYRIAAASFWFERRFSATGKLLLSGIIATAVFGIDTRQSQIYQLFVMLVLLLVLALLQAPLFRAKVEYRRHLPRFVTVDQPFSYQMTITNRGNRTLQDLLLLDSLATQRTLRQQFDGTTESQRNWFDRRVGFPRFMALLARSRGLRNSAVAIASIAVGQSVTITLTATPIRRGLVHFDRIFLSRTDIFGLFYGSVVTEVPQNLLVLPSRYRLPQNLGLSGGRRYQPGGDSSSVSVGEAEEFIGLRDYRIGDSLRNVHWGSVAKRGVLVVKEYQEEYYTRHALIVDNCGSSSEQALDEAVSLASSFAITIDAQESLLDLLFVGERAFRITSGRGMAHSDQLLEILASVEPRLDSDFASLSSLVLAHVQSFSSIIVITTVWNEQRLQFVHKLQANGVNVLVFLIADAQLLPETAPVQLRRLTSGSVQQDLLQL